MKIDPKDTPAPMTLMEQRDKLLAALKEMHTTDMQNEAQFFCEDDYLSLHKRHWPECPACQLIAQIESQIARELKQPTYNSAYEEGPGINDEDEPSPRVQIIRQAKRLIDALNLPEGGGLSFYRGRWSWYEDEDGYGQWSALPDNVLPPWPKSEQSFVSHWITRQTSETEEI